MRSPASTAARGGVWHREQPRDAAGESGGRTLDESALTARHGEMGDGARGLMAIHEDRRASRSVLVSWKASSIAILEEFAKEMLATSRHAARKRAATATERLELTREMMMQAALLDVHAWLRRTLAREL